jgi:hypothetical protein
MDMMNSDAVRGHWLRGGWVIPLPAQWAVAWRRVPVTED